MRRPMAAARFRYRAGPRNCLSKVKLSLASSELIRSELNVTGCFHGGEGAIESVQTLAHASGTRGLPTLGRLPRW